MLIIERKKGQTVYLDKEKLEVLDVKDRSVLISYGGKQYRIKTGTSVVLGNVNVNALTQFHDKMKIGFDAPRSIIILRGELYHKSNLVDIDNSTKQFPSGEF